MPTFTPRDKNGEPLLDAEVKYTPVIVHVLDRTYRLALHKELGLLPAQMKKWVLSEPTTGAKVLTVTGHYRGVPCSSAGFTSREARAAALANFDALIERLGSKAFITKVDAAILQYK